MRKAKNKRGKLVRPKSVPFKKGNPSSLVGLVMNDRLVAIAKSINNF